MRISCFSGHFKLYFLALTSSRLEPFIQMHCFEDHHRCNCKTGHYYIVDASQHCKKYFLLYFLLYQYLYISVESHDMRRNTLFEIFIFCPKLNFDFPRKLSIFLGEKLVKMMRFWTFKLLTTLISREKLLKNFG